MHSISAGASNRHDFLIDGSVHSKRFSVKLNKSLLFRSLTIRVSVMPFADAKRVSSSFTRMWEFESVVTNSIFEFKAPHSQTSVRIDVFSKALPLGLSYLLGASADYDIEFLIDLEDAKNPATLLSDDFQFFPDLRKQPKCLVRIEGESFVDTRDGTILQLRGVNLGGNVKQPFGWSTQHETDWGKEAVRKNMTFVGRPFPEDEAEEHFRRLKRWGFNCLRFLITWEAVEHEAPGVYDVEYLEYVAKMVKMAGDHGFVVFMDPHQDCYSRATGGSGMPLWTFETAGLDVSALEQCNAAFTHGNLCALKNISKTEYPVMTWGNNYQLYGAAHMFTAFWASKTFAPTLKTKSGEFVSEYLQRHYINAMCEVAKVVKDLPNVMGFDSMNEPGCGWIFEQDWDKLPEQVIPGTYALTPFETLRLAMGKKTVVKKASAIGNFWFWSETLTPERTCLLKNPWIEAGLIDAQGETCLKPKYFHSDPSTNKPISWYRDFLRPFASKMISELRKVNPELMIFTEGDPFGERDMWWSKTDPMGVVNASHWYDGYLLFQKRFIPRFALDMGERVVGEGIRPRFGEKSAMDYYLREFTNIKNTPRRPDETSGESSEPLAKVASAGLSPNAVFAGDAPSEKFHASRRMHPRAPMPTLIGEFGIPMDLNNRSGFSSENEQASTFWLSKNFRSHDESIRRYYDAIDSLWLNSTQWTYADDNCNEFGDNWNLEDLSIYSKDQVVTGDSLDDGARGLRGFNRPFAQKVSGLRISQRFDSTGAYELKYVPCVSKAATVVHVPRCHYLNGFEIDVSDEEIVYEATEIDDGRWSVSLRLLKTNRTVIPTAVVKIAPK